MIIILKIEESSTSGYYSDDKYSEILTRLIKSQDIDNDQVSRNGNIINITFLNASLKLDCDFPEDSEIVCANDLISRIGSEKDSGRVISDVSSLYEEIENISEIIDEFKYIVTTYDWDNEDED